MGLAERRTIMTQGGIGPTLFSLTAPMVLAFVSMLAFNLVDTIYVGMLGTTELAAMAFTFPVVFFFNSISAGISTGVTSLISRTVGACNHGWVQNITASSLVLGMVIAVAVTAVGLLTMDPLFRMLGAGGDLLGLVKDYMFWWYLGTFFITVAFMGSGVLRGIGDMKRPMYILLAAVSANLVLDPALIFGWGPLPALGLSGAAIATVIARALTLPLTLWILRREEGLFETRIPPLKDLLRPWKGILKIGVPASLVNVMAPINTGIITAILAPYGKDVVAGFGAGTRLEGLLLMPPVALSVGLIPFIGQNEGAGMQGRVRTSIWISNRFVVLYGMVVYVFLAATSPMTARAFSTDPDVVRAYVQFFVYSGIGYSLISLSFVASSAYNAVGNPAPAAALYFIRLLLLMVPLMLLGQLLVGLEGIFLGIASANILAGFLALYMVRRHFRSGRPLKQAQEVDCSL